MPSEPHGEGDIAVELWKKLELGENDAVWRLSARRHSPLHNNEPELIDYFVSPLGIRESICSAGVEFKRGRTSSSHLRKQMPFALHVAANEYRIARRCPPASFPAKRQFFRMIAIPLCSIRIHFVVGISRPGTERLRERVEFSFVRVPSKRLIQNR